MGKSLVRVKENSFLCGVCSGIAEYFNLDVSKIRTAWVISILFFGTGVLLYVILAIVLDKKEYELVSDSEINIYNVIE